MNKYPYTNGHLMVVPKRHCLDLEQLDDNELKELFDLLKASTQVLKTNLRPHGFNIGMNIGKVGGAGEDHLHLHIVPRWTGDTNFMPVIGETKIIPEYLEKTYQKLHSAFMDLLRKRESRKEDEKVRWVKTLLWMLVFFVGDPFFHSESEARSPFVSSFPMENYQWFEIPKVPLPLFLGHSLLHFFGSLDRGDR